MVNENLKGNVTTIVKFVVMTIASYFSVDAATQDKLISLVVAAIFLIFAYFDAKYPNTFIENKADATSNNENEVEDDGA